MSGVYPDNSVDFKQKLKEFIGNTLLPINQFARGITSKIYIMSDEESQKIIEDFIDFGEVFKEFTDSNPGYSNISSEDMKYFRMTIVKACMENVIRAKNSVLE